ncbi:MAG: transglutaminase-like domain-containing protein [archaeon YNP-WB-062]|nr:transglutaminase-like domain-containing protein [Candidatus Culexarchaeum yellowstonense]
MNNAKASSLMLIALIMSSLIGVYVNAQQSPETYILKYRVKIVNNGKLDYSLTSIENMTLIVSDSYQKLRDLSVTVNGEKAIFSIAKVDDYGNIVLDLKDIPEKLPPQHSLELEIEMAIDLYSRNPPKVSVEESGNIGDIPIDLKEKYCQMAGLWNKSLEAQRIARNLAANKTNALQILMAMIQWIENNIQIPFTSGARMPQYPDETIVKGVGDCDDQSNLLVAMCRSVGIPAYIQMAFIYLEGRSYNDTMFNGRYKLIAKNAGGHAWARVYIPPWGWINVDMTYYIPYKIEGGKLISINPLDHITNGALYIAKTIITENFVEGDYIMDLNDWIGELEKYNLNWEEEYSIKPQATNTQNIILDPIAMGAIILLITLAASMTIIYIKTSRRKPTTA